MLGLESTDSNQNLVVSDFRPFLYYFFAFYSD